MMMMSGSHGRESKYPFTASQWQELEHQALIFKYMAAGHPIPSDLILPIRRSMFLDSAAAAASSPASLFPQHPNSLGWGYFQMGFGRKTEDPEPGRCRRTDGKKWRCSKEAHPDSKYCERHMHRGKNRSRKPVEMSLTTTNPAAVAAAAAQHSVSSTSCSSSTITVASNNIGALYHPLTSVSSAYDGHQMYPVAAAAAGYASSYGRPSPAAAAAAACGIGLSGMHHPSSAAAQFHIESLGGGSFVDRDYNRYFNHGLTKDEVADQYGAGFTTAEQQQQGSWRFTQLGLGATETAKQQQQQQQQQQHQRDHHYQSSLLHHNSFYSHHVAADPQKDEKQSQHCFVLGADIRQMDKGGPDRDGGEQGEEDRKQQKPLRHFFDEWPIKNGGATGKDSWIGGLDDDDGGARSGGGAAAAAAASNNWSSSASSFSNTQLSISTPMAAAHDLSLQW